MRWLGILLAALALLAGCKQPATTPSPTPAPLASTLRKHRLHTPTPSPAPTRTASPTSAPTASPVALPTFAPTPAPTASPAPVLTAAPLLTPPPTAAPTPTDPPPVGNAASGSFTGNGSTGGTVGAVTATPSPTPTPVPTPPSLPPTLVYGDGTNNDNKTTTLLQVQQLLHFCEGLGASQYNSASAFSIDQCPGGGFAYMSYTMLEPHTNGGSAPAPYGGNYANGSSGGGAGTCPAPWNAANPFAATTGTALLNFTSTSSTTNVLNYANGTSIGSDGNAIFGFGSPDLRLFPNLTSTTLQSVTNQILQNCAFAGQGGTKILAFDKVQGMSDNTAGGLLSQHGGLWDGHTSEHYPTDVNCCGGTSPYTSSSGIGTPATYFNGIQHTQGSPINSNCGSAAGDFTCETPTYPGDSDYTNGIVTFLDSLQHRNGTPYMSIVNGMFGGYDACTISAAPNVLAGVKEFAYLGPAENGVPQSDLLLRQLVNVASENQACGGKMFLLLDYLNSSQYNSQGVGTSAPGTPAYEMQLRGHFGFEWAFYDDAHPNMMGSWLQGCVEGCSQAEWSDIYGANFATMNGAVTPYFTKAVGASNQLCGENFYYFVHTGCAITAGGMLDQQNTVSASGGTCAGGSEACVLRRIFAHAFFWNSGACATYDQRNWNATCWHDIGPVVILANLTGGNITLSQNFLNAALTYGGTNYYPLVHDILEPGCQGLASLYGNTAGSPLYPADGLEGTATTAIGCTANTYWDAVNGSHPGGYALTNETSIGTSTGPTLHDTGVVMFSAAAP